MERERNVKIRMKRHQTMMKAWLVSEPSNFIWIQLTNIEQLCPKLYIVYVRILQTEQNAFCSKIWLNKKRILPDPDPQPFKTLSRPKK